MLESRRTLHRFPAQVELYLSTDGGVNFSNTPFATTANDGYARVSSPSGIQTNNARILLKGKDTIFFDEGFFSEHQCVGDTGGARADQRCTHGNDALCFLII